MPRTNYKAYTPANGVRIDFKRLMNLFLASATVRFEQFSEVWRAMNMSYLCAGRNTDREAREFIEKVLVIAREYFLPPYQFQVRVGGLYLLYAVYQIQPISPKAKIRLTSSHWDDALFFQQQAKLQSHLDVVYIFNRLIQEQAFQFCLTPQEIGTQFHAWEGEDAEVDLADEMKEEKCSINKLFNYESLEQLSYLQDQYQRMKIALAGPHATKPDKSLNVVKEELVEDIVVSLQSFKENVANMSKRVGSSKQTDALESGSELQTVGSRRQTLKNQAYAGSITTRKRGLSSSAGSPERNIAIDRANRAAQRALSKSNGQGDSDAELAVSDVSLASPTRSQAGGSPEAYGKKKKLNMPMVIANDELSSDDGSDDDYVPPATKRARGRPCRQKVASRKKQQLKKSVFSPPPSSKIGMRKTSSKAHTKNVDESLRKVEKKKSLSGSKEPSCIKDASKEQASKTHLNQKKNSEKSGFRIKWTPVINLRNSDEITSTTSKSGKSTHKGFVQAFIDSREPLKKTKEINEVSSSDDNSESELSQPTFTHQQNVKQVNVSSNDSVREKMVAKKSEEVLRDTIEKGKVSSADSHDGSSKINTKFTSLQQGNKNSSTYQVVMLPAARKTKSNIFFNANDENPAVRKIDQYNASHSRPACSTAAGSHQSTRHDPHTKTSENGNNILKEKLPHTQSKEISGKKCVRIKKKNGSKSSYEVVFAPAASQSLAELGDNANGLPLHMKFPTAQFSHSVPGNLQLSGQQNQILVSKSLATAPNNPKSADKRQSKVFVTQTKDGEDSVSNEAHKCDDTEPAENLSRHKPSADNRKNSSDVEQVQQNSNKHRKSKYYTPVIFEKSVENSIKCKPAVHQKNLDTAFKNLTATAPKKVPPEKTESLTLQLMRRFREKLEGKKSNEEIEATGKADRNQKPETSKVVMDSFKFI